MTTLSEPAAEAVASTARDDTTSVVIASFARTPFARYAGVFSTVPATVLGAHATAAALDRAGVTGDEVDRVVVGQVIQAGAGQNPARQTSVGGGIPFTVPAITVNAVCLSGMEAISAGVRLIESGEADIVVAVGQESMSLAPHATTGARSGTKYGAIELLDTLEVDGLSDAFEHRSMGASTESQNAPLGINREDQDAWAARSHRTLAESQEFLAGEIVPFTVQGRKPVTLSVDDGLRVETTVETLAKLRPAFGSDGTITAGTASQLTDGAAAVVLMRESLAVKRGITALARIVSTAFVAGPDVYLHAQPSNAIAAALAKSSFETADLAAVEINEAFAAVAIHSVRQLGVDESIVNSHGGAIALGHPIGASGTRIVGHLARRVQRLGKGSIGAAGICGGGGQGSAIIIEAL
ncbi:acetyl-CoA C-acyltransferase [Lacisediminihabitans profunda]|uniref:Probable acetyl-CoA acetyltransferase n=1 Tax=Lacisediminihabitans profunda TaxID=2594790 RepID=A0A5C8UNU9_9MICO|nr:acetyl-CoA C-acyltransferase [Lacisediminihabitans profunda]TXN29968.1 acetyl-CoA C-acyltransferase [Lacisediminihabitans profunda]